LASIRAHSDLDGLRYGKICILADADSDGLHIATLLCALFLQHFTPLVEAGHVFVAMPPLYRIDMAKEVHYALDEAEKDAIIRRMETKKGANQRAAVQGIGRNESHAAARNHHGPGYPPPGSADGGRRPDDDGDHGHAAGQKTGQL
jgi:DNA gyrase/topoisomerase IV subunit B